MPTNTLFDPPLDKAMLLPAHGSWPKTHHHFERTSVNAIRAAIASGRPLLCRGESGIGKSQLARAAAEFLKVPFLPFVVDERSERDDLFYTFDAVARLAQAQVSAMVAQHDPKHDWLGDLAERNYFRPGVMWWAFNWEQAEEQSERFSKHCRSFNENRRHETKAKPKGWTVTADRACGPVVLIDEIDKADPSVPNGLLECLGNRGFQTSQLNETIDLADGAKLPLIIISTNEDREIPAAFLRRCLVLHMNFPKDEIEAKRFLREDRVRVHWRPNQVSDEVCDKVADLLWSAREEAGHNSVAKPGAAEYLDILRVLVELCSGDRTAQLAALVDISDFALRKHAEEGS